MTTQISAGYPLWLDGMAFTGLLGRQFDTGTSVADSGLSATALTPAGGVYAALTGNLQVTAPVSGLTVSVAAGYCCVPSATAQAGGYRFGLMSGGSLTVAGNATGSTRKDLVLATVSDVGSSSSLSEIQYVTGTTSLPAIPASSIVLAEVDVTNGATSITSGMITDKRAYVCSPGGILNLTAAAAAIAAPPSQVFYETDISALVTGSGVAGVVGAAGTGALTGQSSSKSIVTYSSAGHYRWTCPAGVATVLAKCWGAGGGAGQLASGASEICGGAGGGFGSATTIPVTPGTSYSLIVGQGGQGGAYTERIMTSSGANSSFTGDGGASVTAYGGPSDPMGAATEAGLSGTSAGSVGTTTFHTGGSSGQGSSGGGGGGGAGSGGNGGSASGATAGTAGSQDGGAGGTGNTAGTPMAPGGGGGGNVSGGSYFSAGSGAAGQVQLTYTQSSGSVLGLAIGKSLSYDGSTAVTIEILADGATDFEIYYERESTAAGSSRQAYARIAIDGSTTDTTYCQDTTACYGRLAATYRTSSAQGNTPTSGTHVVTLAGTAATSASYTLRAAPVIT